MRYPNARLGIKILHHEAIASMIFALVSLIEIVCAIFDAAEITEHIQDRDDAIFYAVTMDAKENGDAYLITGKKKHFPIRPFVVTPREMLNLLEGSDNNGLNDKTHG